MDCKNCGYWLEDEPMSDFCCEMCKKKYEAMAEGEH